MNTHFIRGNIINQPELKYTPKGLPILTLNVGGGTEKRRWYHRTAVYGNIAEIIADTPINTAVAMHCNVQQRESANGFKYSNLVANEIRLVEPLPTDTISTDANGNELLIAADPTLSSWGLISGNLTRDARVGDTSRGQVANAHVAINEFVKGESITTYIQVSAFSDQPSFESVASLTKGAYVIAQGMLVINRWTDNDGRNRYDPNLLAESILLGMKNGLGATVSREKVKPHTPMPGRPPAFSNDDLDDADLPF